MVAEQPRQLSISFDEQTLSDRLRYRDSRPLDHRFAIEEEDESTGTASEPAEPLTPTSHTSEGSPFSHPFRDDDGSVDDVFATPRPKKRPKMPKAHQAFRRLNRSSDSHHQRSVASENWVL